MQEVRIENKYGVSRSNRPVPDILIERRVLPDPRAEFAMKLLGQWGLVAHAPDGEDSSRRQKFRPASPAEMVDRACNTADLAFAAFEEREWLTKLPSFDEAREQLEAQMASEEGETK